MSELIKKATEGLPLLTTAEAFATGLADRLYEEYLPMFVGHDPVAGNDHNAATRTSTRYFVSRLAELLDNKGYEINRVLFDNVMKLVDDSYFNPSELRRHLVLNPQFSWGIFMVPGKGPSTPRKRVKDVLSVRVGVYYDGAWVYDISGIFAEPKETT